jgi:hypothetical protein
MLLKYAMQTFEDFLQVFTYYLCSRCTRGAPNHNPQDTLDGTGRHAHNGEILHYLQPVAPTGDRILSAFTAYQQYGTPSNIQRTMAKYYNNVQPIPQHLRTNPLLRAVHRLVDYRHSTWIRHGVELPERATYTPNEIYPLPHTRHTIGEQVTTDPDAGRYAVDLERFPFQTCSTHELDHNGGAPWYYTAGYIPMEIFHYNGGEFFTSKDRDHLYAQSDIAHSNWLWVIRNTDRFTDQPAVQKHSQQILQHSSLPCIGETTLLKLHKLLNLLDSYADALKYTNRAQQREASAPPKSRSR